MAIRDQTRHHEWQSVSPDTSKLFCTYTKYKILFIYNDAIYTIEIRLAVIKVGYSNRLVAFELLDSLDTRVARYIEALDSSIFDENFSRLFEESVLWVFEA